LDKESAFSPIRDWYNFMTFSITAIVCGRNDQYGGNLEQRASFCLNSLISTFEEVIYIDYNTINNISLVEAIKDNLIPSNKLRVIKITPEEVRVLNKGEKDPQVVSETFSKNIGIRRATSDFILSTSIEDIPLPKSNFENLNAPNVFYIGAKRRIELSEIEKLGGYKDFPEIQNKLELLKDKFPPVGYSGAYVGDTFSIIDSCGDFQFFSKELAFELKGFEEFLTGRGFLDTKIQKKAMLSGHKVELRPELSGYHIQHLGSFGGSGRVNDMNQAIRYFNLPSKNNDNWGFADRQFTEFNLMDIL
jgi:hypothetical protein